MSKFCPECGSKVIGGKFCPECGAKLSQTGGDVSAQSDELGEALSGLDELLAEQKKQDEKRAVYNKLRVLIIRGKYDEAAAICDKLLDDDPMDAAAYISLVRIASQNYKQYEGEKIDEAIRVAQEVFAGSDELEKDGEYSAYIQEREKQIQAAQEARQKQAQQERVRREEEERERKRQEEEQQRKKREEEQRRLREEFLKQADVENNVLKKYKGGGGNVVIPDFITSIGDHAFCYCGGLTSVIIPNSVTSIGVQAFAECRGLTSVTISDSVTAIGEHAFSDCASLDSISIPNSVRTVGKWAFGYCPGLTSVTIPDSVTSIGDCAFYGCTGLTSVTIPSGATVASDAFPDGCSVRKV